MDPLITRRHALAATLAAPIALSLAPWQPAHAQSAQDGYPAQPVKVVVPFVPGGNADSTARIFAEAGSSPRTTLCSRVRPRPMPRPSSRGC